MDSQEIRRVQKKKHEHNREQQLPNYNVWRPGWLVGIIYTNMGKILHNLAIIVQFVSDKRNK